MENLINQTNHKTNWDGFNRRLSDIDRVLQLFMSKEYLNNEVLIITDELKTGNGVSQIRQQYENRRLSLNIRQPD